MVFAADQICSSGTGKPVPYEGADEILHHVCAARQLSGFVGSFDTGPPQYMYKYNIKALSKKRL